MACCSIHFSFPAARTNTIRTRTHRWATKQRTEASRGVLVAEKADALDALGFEWIEDEAEWLRWFIDLAR